ncbi:MAG: CoA ester lyase, partial [Pseudomonadota bacterium]|nr:CoA ester lyase [Pseudomonadota bacterium]
GDARHALQLGFGGKLLIHPSQIAPARQGFAPAADDIAWARRVVAAAQVDGSAVKLDGAMVDAPVIKRAQAILARARAEDAA